MKNQKILEMKTEFDLVGTKFNGLTWQRIERYMKEFALEVAKVSLKNAANNAKITGDWDNEAHDVVHSVDKKSILSETNIPKI
ncbi:MULTISPECIES: hypothetical protein [Sphingobacterium]|uniref:hypothetical protein n=1 Tax=Sphingobacterium TaxID=28453 RepID=UPI00257CEA07|nr:MULTISPECIES: hypothetical protein [Sphingobacterium]